MAADDAEAVAIGGSGGDRHDDLGRAVLAALAAALQLLRLELHALPCPQLSHRSLHSRAGAHHQTQHTFLVGSGLIAWQARDDHNTGT